MTIKGKDLIERISDKEYSEDLLIELEKYEIKKPKSVWDLENLRDYYFLEYKIDREVYVVLQDYWQSRYSDIAKRILGLAHLTKERAELHARVLNTELAIKKWKRENDNVKLDWKDDRQHKYYLYFNVVNDGLTHGLTHAHKQANTIYMSSRDLWKQCINDIGEERIIEWLKWEDNDE